MIIDVHNCESCWRLQETKDRDARQEVFEAVNELWNIFCKAVIVHNIDDSGLVEAFLEEKTKIHKILSEING